MHTEFYVAIAALIPILVLAISLQSSFFVRSSPFHSQTDNTLRNLYAMTLTAMFSILIGGEGLALHALYYGTSRSGWALYLSIAVAISAMFVLIDFLLALFKRGENIGYYFFLILAMIPIALIWVGIS